VLLFTNIDIFYFFVKLQKPRSGQSDISFTKGTSDIQSSDLMSQTVRFYFILFGIGLRIFLPVNGNQN
jgi:hypothetical protein